jgi:hypothetical protein
VFQCWADEGETTVAALLAQMAALYVRESGLQL